MSLRFLVSIGLCAGAFALVAACAELKTGAPGDDAESATKPGESVTGESTGGSSGSSGPSSVPTSTKKEPPPDGFGPGPNGALPSGYCCTDDSECRGRHCEDLGGGKMCLDSCYGNSFCQRPPDFVWACDNGGTPGESGFCKPPGAFTCIPAAQFELGTRVPGDCCTPTGDGWAGLECVGGGCIAIGDSPYICTHRCEQPKDCPKGFVCHQLDETRKDCIPANRPYTCN